MRLSGVIQCNLACSLAGNWCSLIACALNYTDHHNFFYYDNLGCHVCHVFLDGFAQPCVNNGSICVVDDAALRVAV